MRIALLIGVSKYEMPGNDLPACANDLQAIETLLKQTGEYEDIYTILGDNTPAVKLKTEVSEWIQSYNGKSIQELFFYYTGHGDYQNNEFFFELSDYTPTKPNQTSLTNSELDTWMRSLQPEVAVKVIDACHSGVLYIKGNNDIIEQYFKGTFGGFKKCIFMFSSMVDQSSWADKDISFFTRTFVEAVQVFQNDTIRYRDIMDYIADEFDAGSNSGIQTPIFVTQAHYTEVFCQITDEIRKINTPISSGDSGEKAEQVSSSTLLKEIIENEASKYVTKERGIEILSQLKTVFEEFQYSADMISLYKINGIVIDAAEKVPLRKSIGDWLDSNSHSYFAEPSWEPIYEPQSPTNYLTMTGSLFNFNRKISHYEIDGYKPTVELPLLGYQIIANRKYLSISHYYCIVVLLVSRSRIRFFYFFTDYIEKNWDDTKLNRAVSWKSEECAFSDLEEIVDLANRIQSDFQEYVLKNIKTRYGISD